MEELEMKVRKAMKETFNIEIPDNYWLYSMSEADYEGVLGGEPKKNSRVSTFRKVFWDIYC